MFAWKGLGQGEDRLCELLTDFCKTTKILFLGKKKKLRQVFLLSQKHTIQIVLMKKSNVQMIEYCGLLPFGNKQFMAKQFSEKKVSCSSHIPPTPPSLPPLSWGPEKGCLPLHTVFGSVLIRGSPNYPIKPASQYLL